MTMTSEKVKVKGTFYGTEKVYFWTVRTRGEEKPMNSKRILKRLYFFLEYHFKLTNPTVDLI